MTHISARDASVPSPDSSPGVASNNEQLFQRDLQQPADTPLSEVSFSNRTIRSPTYHYERLGEARRDLRELILRGSYPGTTENIGILASTQGLSKERVLFQDALRTLLSSLRESEQASAFLQEEAVGALKTSQNRETGRLFTQIIHGMKEAADAVRTIVLEHADLSREGKKPLISSKERIALMSEASQTLQSLSQAQLLAEQHGIAFGIPADTYQKVTDKEEVAQRWKAFEQEVYALRESLSTMYKETEVYTPPTIGFHQSNAPSEGKYDSKRVIEQLKALSEKSEQLFEVGPKEEIFPQERRVLAANVQGVAHKLLIDLVRHSNDRAIIRNDLAHRIAASGKEALSF